MAAGDYKVHPAAASGVGITSGGVAWNYGTEVSLVLTNAITTPFAIYCLWVQPTDSAGPDTTYQAVIRLRVNATTTIIELPFVWRTDTAVGPYMTPFIPVTLPEMREVAANDSVEVAVMASTVRNYTVKLGYMELSAGQTISLTHASETDAAQALSVTMGTAQSKTLTNASETDAAQALSVTKAVSLTNASEADEAQALTVTQAAIQKSLTAALETDTAQVLSYEIVGGGAIEVTLVPATEANAAQALSFTKAALQATLTPATEADVAQALAASVGPALQRTLTPATEADVAQAITASLGSPVLVTIIPATESDEAIGILFTQAPIQKNLVAATELDSARPLSYFVDTPATGVAKPAKWYISRAGFYG